MDTSILATELTVWRFQHLSAGWGQGQAVTFAPALCAHPACGSLLVGREAPEDFGREQWPPHLLAAVDCLHKPTSPQPSSSRKKKKTSHDEKRRSRAFALKSHDKPMWMTKVDSAISSQSVSSLCVFLLLCGAMQEGGVQTPPSVVTEKATGEYGVQDILRNG